MSRSTQIGRTARRIASAVREAESAPWPDPAALFDDVQDTLGSSPWN